MPFAQIANTGIPNNATIPIGRCLKVEINPIAKKIEIAKTVKAIEA